MSRGAARRLIGEGAVFVGGRRCRVASRVIAPGAKIRIDTGSLADAPLLVILQQGRDYIAIDKPPGIPSAPTRGRAGGSALDLLSEQLRAAGRSRKLWLVHRLDADTSGVLVFATSSAGAARLSEEFRAGTVRKTYIAVVSGCPSVPDGTIDLPISHDGQRARIDSKGRPASTHWEVLECRGPLAVLKLEPRSGRMHQLRVHLAALGYPVLGDRWYGGAPAPRLMLHAVELRFPAAGGRAAMTIRTPVPADF